MPENHPRSAELQVETVPAWNNRFEDRLVCALFLAIVVGAAGLLHWLYPPAQTADNRVPEVLLHHLTALGNAGEEIQMLRELEGRMAPVEQLAQMGVTPFASDGLDAGPRIQWQQHANCIVGSTADGSAQYQLRLSWDPAKPGSALSVSWRAGGSQPSRHDPCAADGDHGWRAVSNNTEQGHQAHAH